MRTIILLAVVLSAFGTAAEGYLGEVVSSVAAPRRGVRGLAIGPDYIYVFTRWSSDYRVWTCNPANGSVVRSWAVTVYDRGLGYQNPGYIWTRWGYPPYNGRALKRRESTGLILASFNLNHLVDTGGLACQGNPNVPSSVTAIISNRWRNPNLVTRYTTAGSFISSYIPPSGPAYSDCAWDYGNKLIWIPDFRDNAYVYGLTTAGSRVASFPVPRYSSHTTNASSSCYKDQYLYIGGDIQGAVFAYIWKVHCPVNLNIRPASLGRVKALYR
jgi:hypothetical protein